MIGTVTDFYAVILDGECHAIYDSAGACQAYIQALTDHDLFDKYGTITIIPIDGVKQIDLGDA